jgi:hypothetical protein
MKTIKEQLGETSRLNGMTYWPVWIWGPTKLTTAFQICWSVVE